MTEPDGNNPDDVQRIKLEFEQSWLRDAAPFDVRQYAKTVRPDCPNLLNELIILNFDYWWEAHKQGLTINGAEMDEPPSVQTYLRQFPEVSNDDASILELLAIEITNWPHPDRDDYIGEYPRFSKELDAIFELLRLFRPEQLRQWTGSLSLIARALGHTSQTAQIAREEHATDAANTVQRDHAPVPSLEHGQVLELLDQFRIVEGEQGVQIGEGGVQAGLQGTAAEHRQTGCGQAAKAIEARKRP